MFEKKVATRKVKADPITGHVQYIIQEPSGIWKTIDAITGKVHYSIKEPSDMWKRDPMTGKLRFSIGGPNQAVSQSPIRGPQRPIPRMVTEYSNILEPDPITGNQQLRRKVKWVIKY